MMASIEIQKLSFSVGAWAGIDQATAISQWHMPNPVCRSVDLTPHLRTVVARLCQQEPLFGITAQDWPQAFLAQFSPVEGIAAWGVALTVAMQRWARDAVGLGRVLHMGADGVCAVALPWQRKVVLKVAMQFALRYLQLWLQPGDLATEPVDALDREFFAWLAQAQANGLSPNTLRFAMAAQQRHVPVCARPGGVLQLGWGAHQQRLDSSFSGQTSQIAASIARSKPLTSRFLREGGVPIPATGVAARWADAQKLANSLGWPVVVKPSNLDQGEGVVPDIRDPTALQQAFDQALRLSPGGVIVEKHVDGEDHRLLVVGGRMLMATRRTPGGVTGDGVASVMQLINRVNADPRRGTSKRSLMIKLTLDDEAQSCLAGQGLTAQTVPDLARFVRLRRTANISTGGTAVDVTAQVHSDNRVVAQRAASLLGLDIAGVDFLCPDISRSWREVGGAVCEVNAQPGFRVHWLGDPGRDINGEVVDWLFRDKPARIPTAAITGTNGKSTTARMLHHIWMVAGKNAGVCTTNGVWVGHDLVSTENLSGFPGGRMLLNDPNVQTAVIEMPRKGLIVFGHPCDRYDVAALLNIQDDHIGVDGINSLAQMAQLKAEVLERATNAIVVNAEDPLCLAQRHRSAAKRQILVAGDAMTPAFRDHLNKGAPGVCIQPHAGAHWIVLAEGDVQTLVMPVSEIPATMNGLLRFNVSNALFATALAWAQGLSHDIIRRALASFACTPAQNPGRCNFIEGFPFQILLDYAHNPDGVNALCDLVTRLPVSGKRILMSLKLGNRHRVHIDHLAPRLAQVFDRFFIGCDPPYVCNCPDWSGDDSLQKMLTHWQDQLLLQGLSTKNIVLEVDQTRAIMQALANAQPGDLLVLLADPWLALSLLTLAARGLHPGTP